MQMGGVLEKVVSNEGWSLLRLQKLHRSVMGKVLEIVILKERWSVI